jgi:hypothetical protein
MRLGPHLARRWLGLEEFRQHRIMEQLAARIAAQGLGVAVRPVTSIIWAVVAPAPVLFHSPR